jgi:hypothetical protein
MEERASSISRDEGEGSELVLKIAPTYQTASRCNRPEDYNINLGI